MAITVFRSFAGRFWNDQKAQDLIEYALLGAFLTVAVAAFFPTDIAPNISKVMSRVSSMMAAAPGS